MLRLLLSIKIKALKGGPGMPSAVKREQNVPPLPSSGAERERSPTRSTDTPHGAERKTTHFFPLTIREGEGGLCISKERRTEVGGDRTMLPTEALSSSMVARFWCVPLLGCTGLISTWNLRGSSSSSESLDE